MKLGKVLASAAVASSLISAPVAAQAASAENARLDTAVEGESLRGGFIIPLVAIIAIILGIIFLADGSDDDLPHSP